jgi:hypothetical protein
MLLSMPPNLPIHPVNRTGFGARANRFCPHQMHIDKKSSAKNIGGTMKLNRWTVALAAVGAVSLASVAKAEEKQTLSPVLTSLSTTTISGYVDTSAQWNPGTGNAFTPSYRFGGPSKADGFNLDVFQIRIEKALDDTDWAAGYRTDLWAGPDAKALGTLGGSGDFAIRQAYVELRTPVLPNDLTWKMGVFDSIIGYESVDASVDPNFTRSYGHSIEPTTHTGLLVKYQFCPEFSASVGVANTMGPVINSRASQGSDGIASGLWGSYAASNTNIATGDNAKAESYKTYMGRVVITAPESMGFLKGSFLYGGLVSGFNNSLLGSGVGVPCYNAYAGATIATPLKNLTLGFSFDELNVKTDYISGGAPVSAGGSAWAMAGYASLGVTEKLTLHGRCEYLSANIDEPASAFLDRQLLATTLTAQYDLWKNVLTRAEFRWDHSLNDADMFGGTADHASDVNAYLLALNVIYKF